MALGNGYPTQNFVTTTTKLLHCSQKSFTLGRIWIHERGGKTSYK